MHISEQQARRIVDEMKASIHRDVNIMDENGMILASTNPARRGQRHSGAQRVIREGLPCLIVRADEPERGIQQGINLPVRINGRLEGVIGITGDPEEVSIFGDVIKRMTEIMLENIRQQEQQALWEKARSLFIENWLFSGEPDWAELETRGHLLGLDIQAPYTVALLGMTEAGIGKNTRMEELSELRSGRILRMIQTRIREQPAHFCMVIHNKIMLLLCGTGRDEAFAFVQRICRDIESYYGVETTAGISGQSASPPDIRRCFREAKTAQTVSAQTAGVQVAFYDRFSLDFIVQSVPASIRQDLGDLVFSDCTPKERAEFQKTVRLYFECEGDIRKCAARLFVHRNTFQYQMDRLKRKTGYHLKAPKDAFLLYLTLQE